MGLPIAQGRGRCTRPRRRGTARCSDLMSTELEFDCRDGLIAAMVLTPARDSEISPARDSELSPARDSDLSPARDSDLSPARDSELSPARRGFGARRQTVTKQLR
jgi:hypothetical protein